MHLPPVAATPREFDEQSPDISISSFSISQMIRSSQLDAIQQRLQVS